MFSFDQNKYSEKQDYEFAGELVQAIQSISRNDLDITKKLFYFEGIFLDLTDRTLSHPNMNFKMKDRGGITGDLVKSLGLGNQKVVWEVPENFDLDNYFSSNWFDVSIEMNPTHHEEMKKAKDLYKNRQINFFQYFTKRLNVYNQIEPNDFVKFYKGIDLKEYQKKLRDKLEIILKAK